MMFMNGRIIKINSELKIEDYLGEERKKEASRRRLLTTKVK